MYNILNKTNKICFAVCKKQGKKQNLDDKFCDFAQVSKILTERAFYF